MKNEFMRLDLMRLCVGFCWVVFLLVPVCKFLMARSRTIPV